jgi:hypothetical protein
VAKSEAYYFKQYEIKHEHLVANRHAETLWQFSRVGLIIKTENNAMEAAMGEK